MASLQFALGLLVLAAAPVSAAVPLDICADFNTADMSAQLSIYNTNGLCYTTCKDNYAFAITQWQSCWCSNFAPAKSSQVDSKKCNKPCPAYPDEENCGGDGVFGYIALANQPSGTRGPDSPSKTGDSSKSSEEAAPTTTATTRVTETVQTTVTEVSTSAPQVTSSTSSSRKSSSSPDGSSTAPAILTTSYVETITLDGSIKTVTIAPPQTSSSSSDPSSGDNEPSGSTKSDGLSTGAIAGISIGVVAIVAIAAGAAAFWFIRRRKQNKEEQGFQEDPSVRGGSPGTTGTTTNTEMGGGPISATNTAGNRSSMLQIDPRMDPFRGQGLYARTGSHESLNTLRDDQDYSRRIQQPLRATNPDPDVD